MNKFLALDLPELHQHRESHQAARPTDVFGPEMALWMKTKDSIAFAIELKEAEARQKPFYITVPHKPFEALAPKPHRDQRKAATPPPTQVVIHVDSPGNAGAHGAPTSHEEAMPKAQPGRNPSDPKMRVEHLLTLMDASARKGEKCYWAASQIRSICGAHGLEVPLEAQRGRSGRKAKQDAPPHHLQATPSTEASMQPESEGLVVDRNGHTTPLADLGKQPQPFEGYLWFREMDRRLLDNLSHFRNSARKPEEWRQIARDLAILETTAGAARQIAERHAEVA